MFSVHRLSLTWAGVDEIRARLFGRRPEQSATQLTAAPSPAGVPSPDDPSPPGGDLCRVRGRPDEVMLPHKLDNLTALGVLWWMVW